MSSSESRIKDIFWKATKPAAISLCDKGPKAKVNPPGQVHLKNGWWLFIIIQRMK